MASNGVGSEATLQVLFEMSVKMDLNRKIQDLKLLLADLTGVPSDEQCLVYKDRVLENPQTLRSCELEPNQPIQLLRRGKVTVQVKLASNGSMMSVQTDLERTVEKFKLVLTELTDIPTYQQCLVSKGRVLIDSMTLRSLELNQDETIDLLRRVTLQVMLVETGVEMPVRIDLDRTVEDFKRVLSYLTFIPSYQQILVYKDRVLENSQRLMSLVGDPLFVSFLKFELSLLRREQRREIACIHLTNQEDRSLCYVSIMAREWDPDHSIDLFIRDYKSDMIQGIPSLCEMAKQPACRDLLETTLGLHYALLYLAHCCFKKYVQSVEGHSSKPRKIKVVSAYRVHEGTPMGRNQIALGLLGLKWTWTSGESTNANQKKSAHNSQHLPNPWAANYWEEINLPKEQIPESFHLIDESHWKRIYANSYRVLIPMMLCNEVVLGHCKERFHSVDRAFDVLRDLLNHHGVQRLIDEAIHRLVRELNEYFDPVLEMLLAAQSDEDHEDPRDEAAS